MARPSQTRLLRRRALPEPGRMLASNGEHRGIVAALAAKDALGAGRGWRRM